MHHLLYTVAAVLNMLCTILYWALVYPTEHASKFKLNLWTLSQILTHTLPALCCMTNSYFTNTVLVRKMVKTLLWLGAVYLFINFV